MMSVLHRSASRNNATGNASADADHYCALHTVVSLCQQRVHDGKDGDLKVKQSLNKCDQLELKICKAIAWHVA